MFCAMIWRCLADLIVFNNLLKIYYGLFTSTCRGLLLICEGNKYYLLHRAQWTAGLVVVHKICLLSTSWRITGIWFPQQSLLYQISLDVLYGMSVIVTSKIISWYPLKTRSTWASITIAIVAHNIKNVLRTTGIRHKSLNNYGRLRNALAQGIKESLRKP